MRRRTNWKEAASLTILFVASAALAAAADVVKPPAGATSGEAEYRLGPEDVIEVFVWKEPEATSTVVVRPDGRISLPLAGGIAASGKTALEPHAETTDPESTTP